MSLAICKKQLCSFLVWIILFAAYPFVFTYAFGYPALLPILLSTILLFFFCVKSKASLDRRYVLLFFIMLLFFSFQIFIHSDTSYISNITQIVIVCVLMMSIIKFVSLESMVRQYIYVITVIVLFGFIGWLLIFILGYEPLFTYLAQDGRPVSAYLFTVCNTYVPPTPHPIIRYSGIFDEPGTLAFFSMIALCLNKLYLKKKSVERILLFLPLATFSMAHIITVFFYYLFFKIKTITGYMRIALCVILLIIMIASLKDTEYGRLYELSVERFEQSDERGMKGNSRASLTERAIDVFVKNPIIGIGKAEKGNETMASNPFTILACYGILGYFLFQIFYFSTVLQLMLRNTCSNRLNILKCLCMLFINFQQRPFSTNIFYFFSVLLLLFYMDQLMSCENTQIVN